MSGKSLFCIFGFHRWSWGEHEGKSIRDQYNRDQNCVRPGCDEIRKQCKGDKCCWGNEQFSSYTSDADVSYEQCSKCKFVRLKPTQ